MIPEVFVTLFLVSAARAGSLNNKGIAAPAEATGSCFNSTYDIIYAQLVEPREEYVVCPNTHITVGVPAFGFDIYEGGDWPLMALGPDVKILCGASGSSSNNCVLKSSFFHFATTPDFPSLGVHGIWADNLFVSGFTFTGSKFT